MSAFNFRSLSTLAASIAAASVLTTAAAAKPARSSGNAINPEGFRSAIVIDAATGQVLYEDRADVQNPPASVTKLMTFYIVEEKLKSGELKLDTPVTVTAEASHTGGSRVWLVDKEQITVEELLYALMVKSANDAAVALADHISGSKEAFVDLMNLKAQELGLHHTVFHSPHGLPPETKKGQEADLSTARDLATLARKLIVETDVLRYSSTAHHDFRHQNGVVIKLDTHNHLLGTVPGCDGLKTGFYREAGFSLVATVQRGGRRIIAVILGSPERKLRDTVTTQLIERGFAALPPLVAPAASAPVAGTTAPGTSAAGAAPVGAPGASTTSPAPSVPSQPAAAPATGESGPRLIPVGSDEQKPPAAKDAPQDAEVHFAIPGKK
jgi:D-alanyl-D-alanine carboxypeptidase (penicillin-binding protein 5/6)